MQDNSSIRYSAKEIGNCFSKGERDGYDLGLISLLQNLTSAVR